MSTKLRDRITRQEQMSEAFFLSVLLAFGGGFQDAYTYIVRDHVFANAQTGNVVLMSMHLLEGRWLDGLRYLLPLSAFAAGVFIAEAIEYRHKHARRLHWRQGVLILEILIMFLVGFLPQRWNMAANMLVSCSCAMQVHAFRKVEGNTYASTMCIGNLRSATVALFCYAQSGRKQDLRRFLCYTGVLIVFAVGAGLGGVLSALFGERAIWITCVVLALAALLMDLDRENK